MRLSHVPWLLLILSATRGTLLSSSTNRTIDDSLGDSVTGAKVQYLPAVPPSDGRLWFNQTSCAAGSCADALPNAALALDNTWTAAMYLADVSSMSINFQFSGTAIYVFFIIPNFAPASDPSSTVRCVFFIDGSQVGSFTHDSDGSGQFTYDELVYSNSSITNGEHTLMIQTTGSEPAMIIFDYALYTPGMAGNIQMVTSSRSTAAQSTTMPLAIADSGSATTDTQPASSSATPSNSLSNSIPPFPSAPLSSLPSSSSSASSTPNSNPILPIPPSSAPLIPAAAATEVVSEQPTKPIGVIVAGSIAGAFILLGFVVIFVAVCRRRRQRLRDGEGTISSFDLLPENPDPAPAPPSEVLRRPLPYRFPAMSERGHGHASGRSTPNKIPLSPIHVAGMYESPFARGSEAGFRGHSIQFSISSSSDDARSDRLQIHIPVLRPDDPASLPGGLTPLHSAAPGTPVSQLTHAPVHSPITRNGVPMPAAQAEMVRELLLNALTGTTGSRNGSFDLNFSPPSAMLSTPKSHNGHGEDGGSEAEDVVVVDGGEPVVHTDSGIRFSRAIMLPVPIEVPPAYVAR